MFDDFLRQRAERTHADFVPFDPVNEYSRYVDGKPRADGVSSFLASRAIALPRGAPQDAPASETIYGLGNRKNELVLAKIREAGVAVYAGSVTYARAVQAAGLPQAVVSSSANAVPVLQAAGILELFDVCIDARVATERGLKGKPAPDTFLEAARLLNVEPARAAVFEDALAGVEAGRAGGFGFVVGVDRIGQANALRERGADIVIDDLAELMVPA